MQWSDLADADVVEAAIEWARQTGVLLRREALELGMDDRDLKFAVRHGLLRRMRHGMYTVPEHWDSAYDDARHRLLCEGVRRRFGDKVAFTHASALVLHGIAVWGVDLNQVHVTRLDGGVGRTEHGIVHHRGQLGEHELTRAGQALTVIPTRAVLEHICLTSVESGLVSADSALHQEMTDVESLGAQFDRIRHWPSRRSGHIVLRLADGRSESVGESRGRHFCFRYNLPAPELQVEVADRDGVLLGIADFAWHRQKVFGEFDGKQKYGRLLKPGQSVEDVVMREKIREDAMREATNYGFLRWTWHDYSRPAMLLARFQQRLTRRAA